MIPSPALRAIVLCLLAATASAATAETLYVTGQLRAGIHESKELESTIVETVPTGTALEVLERDGAFVRVRAPDGTTGWTDARYLTAEQPPSPEELQKARSENARLRQTVAMLEQRTTELEQQQARAGSNGSDAGPAVDPDALREVQRLAEENQRLKSTLAQLGAGPAEEGSPSSGFGIFLELSPWHWAFIIVLLLLAFALGAYLMDWRIRKRHGGFRV
jgi:SH3 domain protein